MKRKANKAMGYKGSAGWRAATAPPKKENASGIHARKQQSLFRARKRKNAGGKMRRRINIEQGYWADGVFHPIRASSDYNPKRGGDMGERSMSEYARRRRKNPGTKAERAVRAQKASAKRRIAVALKKFLEKQNPGTKLAGAKVQRLKGGVLKITPIKSMRGRK